MTNEQRLAQAFSKAVAEWNGTPFRVDMIRNFPHFVSDDDLYEQLKPIGMLAETIEIQIGYPIVQMGNIIDVPMGASEGWNENFQYYWNNDSDSRLLPREPRQILIFYMDDNDPSPWDEHDGSPLSAHICCGTISYNKRTMGPWWRDNDPACCDPYSANGRYGHVIVHELFHILGFRHPDQPSGQGVPMKTGPLYQPWTVGESIHSASPQDIQVLASIFPIS